MRLRKRCYKVQNMKAYGTAGSHRSIALDVAPHSYCSPLSQARRAFNTCTQKPYAYQLILHSSHLSTPERWDGQCGELGPSERKPIRRNQSVAIPITMEARCFQEKNIMKTLSIDYHELGTDYQDGAE
jgi:hypothetical protein